MVIFLLVEMSTNHVKRPNSIYEQVVTVVSKGWFMQFITVQSLETKNLPESRKAALISFITCNRSYSAPSSFGVDVSSGVATPPYMHTDRKTLQPI